jgi:hypothetical protein
MTYHQALKIAEYAARYLDEKDGNLNEAEALVHIAALHLAGKKIAVYWGINLSTEDQQ